jgi:hypothetical protein
MSLADSAACHNAQAAPLLPSTVRVLALKSLATGVNLQFKPAGLRHPGYFSGTDKNNSTQHDNQKVQFGFHERPGIRFAGHGERQLHAVAIQSRLDF